MAELSTLARPYAKAAFEYADSNATLDAWSEQLALAASIAAEESLHKILNSPSLSMADKSEAIIGCGGESFSDPVRNLLLILAENKRLTLLPQIHELYEQRKAAKQQTVEVKLVSAKAMDDEAIEKLSASLRKKLDAEIQVETSIDETLLGGVVIRAGDTVIDGSVKGRLAKLAEALNSQA